jgi:hypothetical protein
LAFHLSGEEGLRLSEVLSAPAQQDPEASEGDGRHLVAEGLAPARGHEHQRITARDHMLDDGLLGTVKLLVAKNVTKNLEV